MKCNALSDTCYLDKYSFWAFLWYANIGYMYIIKIEHKFLFLFINI